MFATMAPSPDISVLRHQQQKTPSSPSGLVLLPLQPVVSCPMRHMCLMGDCTGTSMRHMCLMANDVNNAIDLSRTCTKKIETCFGTANLLSSFVRYGVREYKPPTMSVSQWDFKLSASAVSLLTEEDCNLLLDSDFLDTADDLLKNFPSAAPKVETGVYSLHDDVSSMYPPSPPEIKPSRAELANDLLQQLDNQCKQENIFPNWLEEKVELPMFESIPGVVERVEPCAPHAVPVYAPPAAVGPLHAAAGPTHTAELLREFEHVYDAVELTHLTPPQSPPGPATQLLISYAHQAAAAPVPLEPWPPYDELASVEELVRARAAALVSADSSPRSSPPSSPRSSTDEEWGSSQRAKPYARSSDDRRSRKKEQNKNAATRYRQKKKAEIEVLLTEEHALRQRHTELGDQCSDLQREIRYLKGLMRDLFKAKGLIK